MALLFNYNHNKWLFSYTVFWAHWSDQVIEHNLHQLVIWIAWLYHWTAEKHLKVEQTSSTHFIHLATLIILAYLNFGVFGFFFFDWCSRNENFLKHRNLFCVDALQILPTLVPTPQRRYESLLLYLYLILSSQIDLGLEAIDQNLLPEASRWQGFCSLSTAHLYNWYSICFFC